MSVFESLTVDQSDWSQIRVTGGDRVRFLQGMCTADVGRLGVGDCVRAMFLSVKGRVLSVFDVVRREDELVLVCEPQLGEPTIEALSKYVIADDVSFEGSAGPLHRVWTDPASVWTAQPQFAEAPGPIAATSAIEARRVEAGFPKYGVDVSADDFPFESPLERFVDYQKGCFIGQEPLARVHARGSATRQLRALVGQGSEPIPVGAELAHADKEAVGTVTSAAISPVFGPIALAYVARIAWEPGTELSLGGRRVTVRDLPLVDAS